MPVEIKELIIRAVVEQNGQSTAPNTSNPQTTGDDKEAFLAACVREVLRILKRSKER